MRTLVGVTILAATSSCAEQRVAPSAEPQAVLAPAPAAVAEPHDPDAILMRMATFLAGTARFTVTLQDWFDVRQESGQMIEFGETRQIAVSRPDRLRVDLQQSDGDQHRMLYDGKDITAFSPGHNVYAQASKPGGIDQAVTFFLQDLHMRLPLGAFLLGRFPEEIKRRTQELAYVEHTHVRGVSAHHLAGRTETVDYQLWIAEGARPLPLRAVLTYKNSEGHPQFRADFDDWNLSPEFRDDRFAFAPPPDARRIAFVAEVPAFAGPGAAMPAPQGEPQ
ncbi:MAG: DUF2092 domain-containing protein [Gammaproteobacteria bacterium]|nr:DUF2092 domain-containing protein [Gammaproteobacteria bacterium]